MKKSRNKIIIKTKNDGYTKLYANGKWQKYVTSLDFHADCHGERKNNSRINIECEFDTCVRGKNGLPIIANGEIAKKHHVIEI